MPMDATGTKCGWLVKVTNNNPEPDFPEDCYDIVECGAMVTVRPDNTGWDCEAGHEYTDMETRYNQGWDYHEDDY